MSVFIRGLIIGISIAAPVGPIGLLCIKRTLSEGKLSGLVSGMGAASADAIYGIVAGFGITVISSYLVAQQTWFRIIGGIFLCFLGLRTIISKPSESEDQAQGKGLVSNYLSIFFLTLSNPMTILSFAAIFAGLGLIQENRDYCSAMQMVSGVFSGSAFWWIALSQGVGIFRKHINYQWMIWINRVSGIMILCFGVLALFS